MRKDFRNRLLMQIEMLRAGISHEELSKRLGSQTEGCLARYIAGKTNLQDPDFRRIARAIKIDARALARQWAASLQLRIAKEDPVRDMLQHSFQDYLKRKRVPGVHPKPSPMAVIRERFPDRLPWQTPPLLLSPLRPSRQRQLIRGFEMLVQSVHLKMSHRDIGALQGVSGQRARQLMLKAAYSWAKVEGIDLFHAEIPWKNEARDIRNLYAGLRFFARPEFVQRSADAQSSAE